MSERRAHCEEDVRLPILEFLEHRGSATTQGITRGVRSRLRLLPDDLAKANKRNEQKIDQIIANALQKQRKLCREGWIERIDQSRGEFYITEKGRQELICFRKKVDELTEIADSMGISDALHE